jgi:hypothetical protein
MQVVGHQSNDFGPCAGPFVAVANEEREPGAPLFTRTTRRVALTSAGTELLVRSKVIT